MTEPTVPDTGNTHSLEEIDRPPRASLEDSGTQDERDATEAGDNGLLQPVSRAMFWNASLLPVTAILTLAASILIRRRFGLESALYDYALGLVNTVLFFSNFGIHHSFGRFVPVVEAHGGRAAVVGLLRYGASIRLAALVVLLTPAAILARPVAAWLGFDSAIYVYLVALVVLGRATVDLVARGLQALFAHLSANLLQLSRAALMPLLLVAIFMAGYGMVAVLVVLAAVSGFNVVVGIGMLRRALNAARLRRGETPSGAPATAFGSHLEPRRFWSFSLFLYVFDLLKYCTTPAFAAVALGLTLEDRGQLAIFATAVQFPLVISTLMVSSFQGLYRPLFGRLLTLGDAERLRTSFVEMAKVQAVLLIPGGVGLAIMVGDYVALLFPPVFAASVPIARVLVLFMGTETLFNLGMILLSSDERYRDTLAAQSIRLLAAPLFVVAARSPSGLLAASAVFGGARLLALLVAHALAHKRYGVRFPIGFVARAALPSLAMALVLLPLRRVLPPTAASAVGLTLLGALTVLVGMRWFRVLGARELDLLRRARLPGMTHVTSWLNSR